LRKQKATAAFAKTAVAYLKLGVKKLLPRLRFFDLPHGRLDIF